MFHMYELRAPMYEALHEPILKMRKLRLGI